MVLRARSLRNPRPRRLLVEPLEERTVLAAVTPALAALDGLVQDNSRYHASRVLVRWQGPAAPEAIQRAAGAAIESARPLIGGLWEAQLGRGSTVEAALAALRANPFVVYAEPDYTLRTAVVPSDSQFSSLWGMHNTAQTGGTLDADIDAPEAWDLTTGAGSTIVAVIDTGVDYRHPDLAANMWVNTGEIAGDRLDNDGNGFIDDVHGYDFINNDGDPLDDQGHGTHVAGTIGAVGNNGVGVAGVNWNVRIMALKFLGADGSGSTSDAIRALNYAVQMGARISNNSYGDSEFSSAFRDAINAARQADHVFVAAAGNSSINNDVSPFYPASYDLANLVSVAATDRNDRPASFTNYGLATVDLAAPGVDIVSTTPNNTYSSFSGTSMASPHVAGVVGLVRGQHPEWTYQQVIDQVLSSTDYLPAVEFLTVTGGRLNAARAVGVPDIDGPRIITVDPSGASGGPVSVLRVTFDESVAPASFTAGDVVSFAGPSGSIAVSSVQVVAGSRDRKFDITFPSQFVKGAYEMVLGPAIFDAAGNPMNQDGDAINGQIPADQFVATFVIGDVHVFRSQTPLSFGSFSTSSATLTIDQGYVIADLDVQLNISYPSAGLLTLTLISPAGTRVALTETTAFTEPNFQDTIFDDEAAQPLTAGTPPYIGAYQPKSPLAALDGTSTLGTWRLEVGNPWFDSGMLHSWSLRLVAHPPRISVSDVAIAEGDAGTTTATFAVALSNPVGETVAVEYATADGTAIAGSDYDAASGQLVFAPGEQIKTVIVTVRGDTLDEPDETFFLNLFAASGATLAEAQGVATIRNDEARLLIGDVRLLEGDSGTVSAVFGITLSTPSNQTIVVDYGTAGGTATSGTDYVAASGTLTFQPGQTSKTIAVGIKGDTQNESDETFFVNLVGAANALVDDSQGLGSIANDDPLPAMTIADVKTTEGNSGAKTFNFNFTLSAASGRTISVDYATLAGTATAGVDFTAASGTVIFNPGQTSRTISIVVAGDLQAEADETFFVQLTSSSAAVLLDSEATATIQNDDTTVRINDVTWAETDDGLAEALFTVSLSAAVNFDVRVNFATANSSAASGSDYLAATGTLVFASGQVSQAISVIVIGDMRNEADETFFVNLTNPIGAVLADSQASATIIDNDPLPSLSIAGVSLIEGNSGTRNMSFVVSLSAASGKAVSVQYATANGTASAGSDYAAKSGTLTFFAGSLSQTVNVTISGDTLNEADETLFVNLSSPGNALLAENQAVGVILDEDNLTISDPVLVEGDEGVRYAAFAISLATALPHEVRVNYATANGTAAGGSDYLGVGGTLVLAAGETSQTIMVPVLSDRLNEPDETVVLNLSQPVGVLLTDTQGVATITDDDPLPSLSVGDAVVVEGNSGTRTLTFAVSLSAASGRAVSVQYATADGTATAGSDYVAKSGSFTLFAGNTSLNVSVTVNGDTAIEPNETVLLNVLGVANATIGDEQGVGTIATDDPAPAMSIADAKVTEGNSGTKTLSFTVTLSTSSTQTITAAYATADGTAHSGVDFTPASGTVTFSPGQTSRTISVVISGDTVAEPDETFFVQLSNPVGGTLLDADAFGTILNDDTNLRMSDVTWAESDDGLAEVVFTATLSAAVDFEVRANFATGNNSASAGSDYLATGGTLVFPPGQTSQTIRVFVMGDTRNEANELFVVNLTNPASAILADSQGAATIVDNDPLPSLSIADASVTEGNSGTKTLSFVVSLSAASGKTVSVQYATANGTATAGSDYVAKSGTLTFFAGSVSQTISITISGDTQVEADETFVVTLTSPGNALLGDNQAEGVILDEDNLTISDPVVTEGNDGVRYAAFVVSLAIPLTHEVRVNYATANGAANGGDYLGVSGMLVLPAGQTSQTILVPVLGDRLNEPDEAFSLNLSQPVGVLLTDTQAVATITDDDPQPSLSVSNVTVAEGNSGTKNLSFTVSLSAASGRTIAVQYATADGTATAGSDYLAKTGTLTFLAGWTVQTINVTITGDASLEPDETLLLSLFDAANAAIATGQASGSILNDDEAGGASGAAASVSSDLAPTTTGLSPAHHSRGRLDALLLATDAAIGELLAPRGRRRFGA